MDYSQVLFSKQHLLSPFSHEYQGRNISILDQKVKTIALSIFIGLLTLGVGGVLFFYALTAKYKVERWQGVQLSQLQTQPGKVSVVVDRTVLTKKCSDHSIVTFKTPTQTLISSNVMCCGEKVAPLPANSYSIDPTSLQGRKKRFEEMVGCLAESKRQAGGRPVLALQEFPRRSDTRNAEFKAKLLKQFPDYQMVFGQKDSGSDENSQLCMLFPKAAEVRSFPHQDSRVQVVRAGQKGYINVHPSPCPRTGGPDPFIDELKKTSNKLFQMGCAEVHILGDWNRKRGHLITHWGKGYVHSSKEKSHFPPGRYYAKFLQGNGHWPGPVDHHVMMVRC